MKQKTYFFNRNLIHISLKNNLPCMNIQYKQAEITIGKTLDSPLYVLTCLFLVDNNTAEP
jgi:hypothetical protein